MELARTANTVLDECESTNDLARQMGEAGFPHGTWVSTRKQTAGRGRMGREWESLEGNLFLSLILRVEKKTVWTWIPIAGAMGAATVLRARGFDVRIKWPNDLWIHDEKVAGLLCEAVGSKQEAFVVMGIGLNCRHTPEVAEQRVTSLSAHSAGEPVSADDVRASMIEGILEEITLLSQYGPDALARRFEEIAAFPVGSWIQWGTPEVRKGRVLGLGSSGELFVEIDGKKTPLFAEEIRAVRRAADESLA